MNKGVIAWISAAIILAFAAHIAINALEAQNLGAAFQPALETRAGAQALKKGIIATKTATTIVTPTTTSSLKQAFESTVTEQSEATKTPQFYVITAEHAPLIANLALSAAVAAAAFLVFRSKWA